MPRKMARQTLERHAGACYAGSRPYLGPGLLRPSRKSLQFAPLPSSSGESRILLVRHPPIPWWDGSLKLVNNVAPLLHLPDLAPN